MLNRNISDKLQYLKPFYCVKQVSSCLFKNNVSNKLFVHKPCILTIYLYKQHLALNNEQGLI